MAQIITINALKGGVSKSTLTLNLYYYYQEIGFRCGIIDADLQGSLSDLAQMRPDFALIPRQNVTDWGLIKTIGDKDILLIDTGPYMVEEETMAIFAISNFVLMPCKASLFDIQALNATIGQYDRVRQINPALKAGIILTQGIHSTGINNELRQEVLSYQLPVLATEMKNRVDYARSLSSPKGVFSTENTKAINEIKNIGIEIQNLISNGRRTQ